MFKMITIPLKNKSWLIFLMGLVIGGAFIYFISNSQQIIVSNKPLPIPDSSNTTVNLLTYTNFRFQFAIDYPSNWPVGKESDNGDGIAFYTGNHVNEILVYGSNYPSTFLTQDAPIERNVFTMNNDTQATSIKYVNKNGEVVYIVYFTQNNKQYVFFATVSKLFFNYNEQILQSVAKSFRILNQSSTPTLNPTLSPTLEPVQRNTESYRQKYINSCGYGAVYCTCLYDALSQHNSDSQIVNIKDGDPELINAYGVCNSRFGSK